MLKKISFLTIAAGITVVATFVQQLSSSDRPYKTSININKHDYNFTLPVIQDGDELCLLMLNIPDTTIKGKVFYRRLDINEAWKIKYLTRKNDEHDVLWCLLPQQKPNIKILYYIELESGPNVYCISKNQPIIVRFQGSVPKYFLFPQVALMFVALIFACFAGILALFNADSYKKYTSVTFYLLIAGALILGLLVHFMSYHHLFVDPFGHNDLTLYRNLVIFLLWWGVYSLNKKLNARFVVVLVSVVTLILYCLPQHIIISWMQH